MRWTLVDAAVLLGVAGYMLAFALGADASGEDVAVVVALVAMLAGAFLSAWRPLPVLGPAAALALLARWYGFDPYYAPSRRRYSDGGILAAGWVYGLLVASLLLAALTVRRPREAGPLTSAFVLLVLVSFAVVGAGH